MNSHVGDNQPLQVDESCSTTASWTRCHHQQPCHVQLDKTPASPHGREPGFGHMARRTPPHASRIPRTTRIGPGTVPGKLHRQCRLQHASPSPSMEPSVASEATYLLPRLNLGFRPWIHSRCWPLYWPSVTRVSTRTQGDETIETSGSTTRAVPMSANRPHARHEANLKRRRHCGEGPVMYMSHRMACSASPS